MVPTEPWQTGPKEGGRGKERKGEKPALNKRSSTEVESVGGGWVNYQHVGVGWGGGVWWGHHH